MRRKIAFFVFSFFFLLNWGSPANALFNNEVDKAKDFIKAGMYPQAIELLNKRINEKPTDAEAHYILGTCYMETGNYGAAEERFKSALRLKADYGYKIGGEFKQAGFSTLNKGRVGQAQNLFAKAVEYQPDLKKEVAQECFTAGKSYLNRGQSSVADGLFSMASRYDGSLGNEIRQITTDYGKRLLEAAENKPKGERRRYIDKAKKYLSQNEIDAVFPPPEWREVYRKTFVGIGYTGGDEPEYNDGGIYTAEHGKDILIGDRCTVIDSDFEVWESAGWHKYNKGHWLPVNKISPGDNLTFRNEKGKKFTVVVERYIETY